MSIQKITPDNLEFFTIEAHPSKSYSSRLRRDSSGGLIYFTGSQGGLELTLDNTGSVNIFAIRSPSQKEVAPLGAFGFSAYKDDSLDALRTGILQNTSTNIESPMQSYLDAVNNSTASLRQQQKLEIIRFTPTFNFSSNTVRKNLTLGHLMPFYRKNYASANYSYSNYHCLNFFADTPQTGSFDVPRDSVLLYPNSRGLEIVSGVYDTQYGHKSGSAFSFDFWINPRYTINNETDSYKPGTVFHLSGAYAVSLVSGSSRDENGKINKFRLQLQLGVTGSGILPELATTASEGVFLSDDNVLDLNTWHHVTIRYGGSGYNEGSGSFLIDTINRGNFNYINNGIGLYNASENQAPAALAIGNYFDGPAILEEFFNANAALRDGLIQLSSGTVEPDASDFSFDNPLNAEVHDLKIYDKYLTTIDHNGLQLEAPSTLANLKFYLPPFFTEESPFRQFVGNSGGELITPFFERNGTTLTPFAADMAFGAGGHYINLENYVRDFASARYPRLWKLTGSASTPPNSTVKTANYFLYSSGSHAGFNKKRHYTVLPCDNGGWSPNFKLLEDLSGSRSGRYSSDLGKDLGLISLKNIVTQSLTSKAITTSGSILDDVLGTGPESGSLISSPGSSLTMLHRLRDSSSNQVVFFDVSNLFYGNRIKPGTFKLSDPALSGSDKKFGMTIRDDKYGNLYRADAIGSHPTWSSIGNIFYDEGIVVLKSPQLFFFGDQGFDVEFKGMQNIHVMTINAYANPMQLISSSNPTYLQLSASSDLANEPDQQFVYITGINIHDENLNVIAKTHVAQPIVKRTGDKFQFKVKIDM